jgi:geranylgeranyl pyrophosphate synthase
MHILHGNDFAINYGDYLRSLGEHAMDKGLDLWDFNIYKRLVKSRHEMIKTTIEGQDLEFQLRIRPLQEMTEKKILNILRNKTAFYTIWTPYRYGCIISGLSDEQTNPLKSALLNIGIAFQIQDDILDLRMSKKDGIKYHSTIIWKFGESWAGDLEEIKRTLLLYYLFNRVTGNDLRYIRNKLDTNGEMKKLVIKRDTLRKNYTPRVHGLFKETIRKINKIKLNIIQMMDFYKVIKDSQDFAKKLYKDNISIIESLLPETEDKKEFLKLLHFAVFRTF